MNGGKRVDLAPNFTIKEGDIVQVKLIEVDKKTGKFRLSAKALLPKPEKTEKSENSEN